MTEERKSILSEAFLEKYKKIQPPWGFGIVGWVVFKRTYARTKSDGTLEEWWETIRRCIDGLNELGANYSMEEAERLFDHVFNLRCSFAGRSLWQLGTSTVREVGLDSLLNCWVKKINSVEDFCFVFMQSMLGGGVGCVVTKEFTHELPRVRSGVRVQYKNTNDADFIVPDSKEGWCELWRRILNAYLIDGKSFTFSTVCIRPNGAPIKRFGGTAPGPKPLVDGALELIKILENRYNKKLRTQDVCDIICVGGELVKSGGIRRTALLLQGDVDDAAYLSLKRWDLGNIPNYRSNSNNSLITSRVSHLSEKYWDGFGGNGEAYGLINVKNAKRYGRLGETVVFGFDLYDDGIIGYNPCQPSWAKLLTPNGIRQMSEIQEGDLIWSKEGWTKVLKKWSNGIKPVFKYQTTAGTFNGTESHRLVSDGVKTEAKDCESIDIISGPAPDGTVEIDPKIVMDGLVLGDGSVHKASGDLVHLCIGKDDTDYFSSEVSNLITSHRSGVCDYAYEIITSITSSELPKTFNRRIPDRFFYGNYSVVCSFLRGLYSANGSVCGNRITLKASSFAVIEQVQTMLSSIGIRSYYTTNKANEVEFSNGTYICKQSYDLNISTDRKKFVALIGFIQKYKQEACDKISVKDACGKKTFDIISSEIISTEEVFDITVDNHSHTYWTQCCDVSNCAEATLSDSESCNLAELFLNRIASKEQMLDCAKLLYKGQKAISLGNYLYEETNAIVHKNMRLGLGVTGVCQLPVERVKEWCDFTYKGLRQFDKDHSNSLGVNQSIRLTVVKPSGTLSLLGGAKPGGHAGYSKYHIRRIRFASSDALLPLLRKAGYHMEPEIRFDGTLNHDLIVVDFPCHFDDDGPCAEDLTAIDQLNMVVNLQTWWADQAVSVTIYYKEKEIPAIKKWLSENYDSSIKSVSFLLHSGHGFKQAPLEEISKDQYHAMLANVRHIDTSTSALTPSSELDSQECTSGHCPIK